MKWKVEERGSGKAFEFEANGNGIGDTVAVGARSTQLTPAHRVATTYVAKRKDVIQVSLNGRVFEFKVTSPEERIREALHSAHQDGAETLEAKMPGKILSVAVKPGDSVSAGQTLVVLEAMKMENHLSVNHSATVGEVHVAAQQIVEAGQVLITFKDK